MSRFWAARCPKLSIDAAPINPARLETLPELKGRLARQMDLLPQSNSLIMRQDMQPRPCLSRIHKSSERGVMARRSQLVGND